MNTLSRLQPCALGSSEEIEVASTQGDLFDRIRAFSFDDADAAVPFAARLARQNNWSRRYAERAIEEYKRFMFLAVVAGHPVTPSDQVDQVWHLHLLYTRSYWDRFCGEVLGRRVDHGPTKGGPQESSKFEQWYEMTLVSYRRIFGEPPADLWPPSDVRFGEDLCYVRVNAVRNCIIPRASLRKAAEVAVGVALLLLLLISSRIS
jgi:hypothetical protein